MKPRSHDTHLPLRLQLQHGSQPQRKSRRCEISASQAVQTPPRFTSVGGDLVVAETGMSGSVCHHTRECSGTLIPMHLSFSTWSCKGDIVIGDRVDLRGPAGKMDGRSYE